MNILITAATVIDPNSDFHNQKVDILIESGIVSKIGTKIALPKGFKKNSFENCHVSLGWFDSSVSFGEPGYEERETIENGIQTAAKSGFTRVILNSNVKPVPNQASAIKYPLNIAKGHAVNVHPVGALTMGAEGEALAELFDMQQAGAVGFYDYQLPVNNANLLKIALQYTQGFNGLVFSFPMQSQLGHKGVANEEVTATNLGLKGIPAVAESLQIQRDLSILEYTGGKLHFPTISTKESVTLLAQAKKKGLDVSCSVALPHLWFTDSVLENFDTNYKLLPPLRTETDRQALIEGVLDGTIDFVTSDHNPLDIENKKLEFDHAAFGSTGLQSMFGILNQLFDLETVIKILTGNSERFGIESPYLKEGAKANICVFNPEGKTILSSDNLLASSKNAAFLGETLQGKVYGVYNNTKWIENQ